MNQIDERWMRDWLESGFKELDSYLRKHAAFDNYCRTQAPTLQHHNLRTTK